MEHRLSCPEECEIFLDQGSNSCLLHWQMDSLPLSHQGSPLHLFFLRSDETLCIQWSSNSCWHMIGTQEISAAATANLVPVTTVTPADRLAPTSPSTAWRSYVPQICLARGSAPRGFMSYKKEVLINYGTWKLTCYYFCCKLIKKYNEFFLLCDETVISHWESQGGSEQLLKCWRASAPGFCATWFSASYSVPVFLSD